jgi:prepilin-type N-terminal cleavage/methylation domain-containing protein
LAKRAWGLGMTKNPGFTLMELMIALAIIAIISTFTIINFIRWLPNAGGDIVIEHDSTDGEFHRM